MYTLISTIWNGKSGDDGYRHCLGGYQAGSKCSFSVRNIRVKGVNYKGICTPLNSIDNSKPKVCKCTKENEDVLSTGKELRCCDGLKKVLVNWD